LAVYLILSALSLALSVMSLVQVIRMRRTHA
jgi:hypothetical protein